MTDSVAEGWNAERVGKWLDSRIVSARADQAVAERGGRKEQDDCDKASAEEMVCTLLKTKGSARDRQAMTDHLAALLDRDDYTWRGVHDDVRFERHVRSCLRKLAKMTKTSEGFDKVSHYQ